MVGQAIKTFLVSFFILLIVHRLITRHLTAITTSLREYDLRGSQAPLRLERRPCVTADELDHLIAAFNQMYARLQVAQAISKNGKRKSDALLTRILSEI